MNCDFVWRCRLRRRWTGQEDDPTTTLGESHAISVFKGFDCNALGMKVKRGNQVEPEELTMVRRRRQRLRTKDDDGQ